MRIAVIGTSGAGKTSLARALGARLAMPHVELDALNWEPGWRSLAAADPPEFTRRVAAAVAQDAWVIDGGYATVRHLIWSRASHIVWLDFERHVIMYRVCKRSLARANSGQELWAGTGNRETWRRWGRPSHPIRWAWHTWRRRRSQFEAALAGDAYQHITVLRVRHPRDTVGAIEKLAAEHDAMRRQA